MFLLAVDHNSNTTLLNCFSQSSCKDLFVPFNSRYELDIIKQNIIIDAPATKNCVTFSQQADYTDLVTAAGQRTSVSSFADRVVLSGQGDKATGADLR
jgi:hypothetical protein